MAIQAASTESGTAGPRIVYVLSRYPDLTTTFIDREIVESTRLGTNLTLLAISRAKSELTADSEGRGGPEIRYILPVPISRLVAAHWRQLRRATRSYLSTLAYLVTRPHDSIIGRFKTIVHFAEGIVAADMLGGAAPDHVHAHFADRAAVVAIVVSRMLRIPYSVTAHAYDIYRSPVFLQDKIRGAAFATTCTGFNKEHLERETGMPVELIYHGLDFEHFSASARAGRAEEKPLILSVGRLQEKKGFADLIRACHILREQGVPFRCEIIGEGPERASLERLIRELALEHDVVLIGARRHHEVMQRYREASVFVLACAVAESGDQDGIPNVILEAMAAGVPVISTRISGIPEVVRNMETGLLVESRMYSHLAEAIGLVLRSSDLADGLARAGAEFVREHFDIRRNVTRLLSLFNR